MLKKNIYTFKYKICANGHIIHNVNGEVGADFCQICGAKFLIKCPECERPLPSSFGSSMYFGTSRPVNVPNSPGACDKCGKIFPWTTRKHLSGPKSDFEANQIILNICTRFHKVVKQLRNRYNNRSTIDVDDEYDVQDLLHALLKLSFDDIRKEEWTPSYAGGSSRMDFLINPFGIVVEVKKTRKGLADKELGKQLIDDIVRYKSHPNCTKLICFIYDPEERVNNSAGLISDLKSVDKDLKVEICISPTR